MTLRLFATLVALLMSTFSAYAGKKVALVVGVGAYTTQNVLESSRKDSILVGNFLKQRGFDLVGGGPLADLNKAQYDWAIEKFSEMAQGADQVVFYYSGHGMQIGGTNYLFPVDSPFVSTSNIQFRFINMGLVMNVLERSGARLKLVVLDACRNNPFVKDGMKTDASTGGLATMNAPAGTIIGFATQPGNTASDGGAGNNSPYTAALVAAAEHPGYNQFRVFNEAALTVMNRSNGRQQPWMSASPITEDFYFTPPLVSQNNINASPATPALANVMPAPAQNTTQVAALGNSFAYAPATQGGVTFDYTQRANELFQQFNYTEGRSVLTAGINAGQRTAMMYSYRGYSWLQDGLNKSNLHEALAYYRAGFLDLDQAIQTEKTYPNSYRHRGNMIMWTYKALKKTGQRTNRILDKAIEDLTMAANLDPTSYSNAYFLGEAYNLRGEGNDYDMALYWFKKALDVLPRFVHPHAGMCYAYRMKGDRSTAEREAKIAASRADEQRDMGCLTKVAWERFVPRF